MANILPHHIKEEVCLTRPKYREGRKPKGVKVYTCAQESKYLIITNIPSIGGIKDELVKLFQIYGTITEAKYLDEYPNRENEEFKETYLIKYEKIQNARIAKIKMDDYNFCGSVLHICYAPEYESVDELHEKLNERQFIVKFKSEKYDKIGFGTLKYDLEQMNAKPFKKKKKIFQPKQKESGKTNDQQVYGPKLESGAFKSIDAIGSAIEASVDKSVKEIRSKLKPTIPHQQDTYEERQLKKKKRKINI